MRGTPEVHTLSRADTEVRPYGKSRWLDDHRTNDTHPHPALRATFPLGGGRLFFYFASKTAFMPLKVI